MPVATRFEKLRRDNLTPADEDPDYAVRGVFPSGATDPRPLTCTEEVSFHLLAPCPMRIRVYSVSGELVRVLFDGQLSAGRHSVLWDGTSERGLPVAPGLYLCRLEAPALSTSHKLLVVRWDGLVLR